MGVQGIVVTAFEWSVAFVVPAVVWITLAAGLFQLVRRGVRRVGAAVPNSQSLARKSVR